MIPRASGVRRHHYAARVAIHVGLVLLGALFLVPIYVVIVTAFKPLHEVVGGTMLALPAQWTTAPLVRAWSQACIGSVCEGLAAGVWTSVAIALPASCCSVMLGAVNGYALTRWNVPGGRLLFGLLLAANVMPYQVVLLPMAVALRMLGLFGTKAGLVLVHVVYGMPYMTLLFRTFFMAVPDELIGAARTDGGRFWSIFVHVMLPLARPMLVAALGLQCAAIWNDYLFGLVFGGHDVPVTVMLGNLIANQSGEKDYSVNMAGVLIAVVPVLFVFSMGGRLLMRDLAVGPRDR